MKNLEVAENPNPSEPKWYSRLYQMLYVRRKLILAICGVMVIIVVILCSTYISSPFKEVAAKTNITDGSASLTTQG